MYQRVYIWLMTFALNFGAAVVVVNCVLTILIDVYRHAPAAQNVCTLSSGLVQMMCHLRRRTRMLQ